MDDRRAARFSLQVGNAFTFDEHLVGSLTRIQADAATCGPGGAATVPGITSTGLQALSWTSTKRGIQRVIPCEQCMTQESTVGLQAGQQKKPPSYLFGGRARCQVSGARCISHMHMPACLCCCACAADGQELCAMRAADAARPGVDHRGADRVARGRLGLVHQGLGEF